MIVIMIRTQIQLTEKQSQRLKAVSAQTGESVAALIRRGVNHVLTQTAGPTKAELRARALEAVGRFSSGAADTAERHDQYLGGALAE